MIIDKLEELVNKALEQDEVPVAAVVVKNDQIIGEGYNQVERYDDIMYHAEIIAINEAKKKLNNWRLNDCDIYITLEPCSMCSEIIKKHRIKNIYYYSKQNENKTENNPNYYYIESNKFSSVLSKFFKDKR